MFKIKIKFRYNVSKYNILFNLDVMPIWLKSFLYKSNYNYVILVYELKNIWCNYWAFINHESLLVIIESFLMCNTYKYSCKIKVVVRIALQCYIWLPSLLLLWFFDMYDLYIFIHLQPSPSQIMSSYILVSMCDSKDDDITLFFTSLIRWLQVLKKLFFYCMNLGNFSHMNMVWSCLNLHMRWICIRPRNWTFNIFYL